MEDLAEVAHLAKRRMLDVMLGVVLSMARKIGPRMAGFWGVKNGQHEWFNQKREFPGM